MLQESLGRSYEPVERSSCAGQGFWQDLRIQGDHGQRRLYLKDTGLYRKDTGWSSL